jgi:putative DNA primase/helicase
MVISFQAQALQAQTSDRRLNDRHYTELTSKRGLAPDWVSANCYSADIKQASEALAYRSQSAGILLQGRGWQMQFKPDRPWKGDGDKKAPKYRSPLGDYDVMFPSHPTDITYWNDLEALKQHCIQINGHFYIVITEGFFKAIAGCSNGIPTIALLGVEMGLTSARADPQGKRYLVKSLEKLARARFGFIFGFDADSATNRLVTEAERKLTFQLKKFDIPVLSITGMWTEDEGKGMDDFIQKQGIEEFRRMLLAAEERQWNDQEDKPKSKKNPPADVVARAIAEAYSGQLAFNNEISQWMRYGADQPGMWSVETDEFMESIVSSILDVKGITGYNSHSYITNIVKKLRCILIERKWAERSPKELLPFRNGVVEVATGKLLPHSPDYRLTWQLPREHNPLATNWNTIDAYLDHLCGGNAALKDIYLCFCNAVLTGRADLQKFLHMIGIGGSGKGTFARLVTDLIGEENILSTTLEDWCSNRFESANAYRKRLVVFWDEDKQTGNIGKFLSLTGGDWIRAEEKGKKGFQYRYDGMTLVMSNTPIFTGSAASRIKRRVITTPCNAVVSTLQVRDIGQEFKPELDAFTNYVLSIPDSHVTAVLRGLKDVPECTLEFWENRMRVDSIASWLNDRVIYDPLAKTAVGCDKDEAFNGTPVTLYGSYCHHARQSGAGVKSHRNFSPDLLELCRSVLGWEVEHVHTKTGKFIRGLRLRTDTDDGIPTHDFILMQRVTDGEGSGDGLGDGSESLSDKAFEQGDGLTLTRSEKIINEIEQLEVKKETEYSMEVTDKPSPPLKTSPGKGFEQSPNLSPNPSPDEELVGWNERHAKKPYPNPKSNNVRSSQKRTLAIRNAYRAARCQADLTSLRNDKGGQFSKQELAWVRNWLGQYFRTESNHLEATTKVIQGNLLE